MIVPRDQLNEKKKKIRLDIKVSAVYGVQTDSFSC